MSIATIDEIKNTKGRIMGVDFGEVRTGIAISDASRFLASGIGYIKEGGLHKTAERIAEMVKEENVSAVVIGCPVNMNGTEGPRAERCRDLAREIGELTSLPVAMMDERMTTMAASRFLNETNTRGAKRKTVIDTLSAQIILQNFIDRLKNI
ncbi:MAG: Holliday junction resolvase RuvX [Clostridia bacterium]|nr:Holliday junction resolvase RuvX [Clostridia bacterium]